MSDPRILMVEDDANMAALVTGYLRQSGYEVAIEGRGDHAEPRILAEAPSLVLLDISLPGRDGLSICRSLRAQGYQGPIVMFTARRGLPDEIAALESGADDFVTKPVQPRRLLARVQAALRRDRSGGGRQCLERGQLTIDAGARAAWIAGQALELTSTEFDLLWLLALHAGTTLSREHIYQRLLGRSYGDDDRSIDLQVSRLRHKTGPAGLSIKSVRGVGYQLTEGA